MTKSDFTKCFFEKHDKISISEPSASILYKSYFPTIDLAEITGTLNFFNFP